MYPSIHLMIVWKHLLILIVMIRMYSRPLIGYGFVNPVATWGMFQSRGLVSLRLFHFFQLQLE